MGMREGQAYPLSSASGCINAVSYRDSQTLITHTCEVLKERILLKGRRVQAQFDLTPIAKRDLCGTSVTFSVLEDNGKVHGLPDCMTAPITALITAGGGL